MNWWDTSFRIVAGLGGVCSDKTYASARKSMVILFLSWLVTAFFSYWYIRKSRKRYVNKKASKKVLLKLLLFFSVVCWLIYKVQTTGFCAYDKGSIFESFFWGS